MTEAHERLKRGKARSTTQLSENQRKLLMWVFQRECEGDPHIKRRKDWIGVPCSAKLYYDDAPTNSQKSSLSTSLTRLEERSLIYRHSASKKGHKTHVKLTASGQKEALRLCENRGQSERELYDARSGLQKWLAISLRKLNAELEAQLKLQQDLPSFRTNMQLPLDNLSNELSEEQLVDVEKAVENNLILDNKHTIWSLEQGIATLKELANDPRLQSGDFPFDKIEAVIQHARRLYRTSEIFIVGLEALQGRHEQVPIFFNEVPGILDKFDLTVDSIPVEVYRYVDNITVNL